MTIAQVELRKMNTRLAVAPETRKRNAHEALKHAMRLMVRAANQDRGLIEDKDWQQVMTFLNEINRKALI